MAVEEKESKRKEKKGRKKRKRREEREKGRREEVASCQKWGGFVSWPVDLDPFVSQQDRNHIRMATLTSNVKWSFFKKG